MCNSPMRNTSRKYFMLVFLYLFQGIAETMGQAAASTLSATIQTTYREAFHSTVIPAFERSCASMFEQINGQLRHWHKRV